jgi:protein gp37
MLEPIILNEWWLTDFPSAEGLKWVICGCESGPGARPMDMYWARSLRDQCLDKGIPFFLKQARDERGRLMKMPELDGKVWAEFPGDLLTD